MTKLLIGGPIRQKNNILKEFLKSLEELDLSGIDVSFYFVDDNVDKDSIKLLNKFESKMKNVIIKNSKEFLTQKNENYVCNTTHVWKKELIARITEYKNSIIEYARQNNFDYLFFVDSDIVLNPNTIKHLISRKVDIVSEVFWTKWNIGDELSPQVWLQDESSYLIRDWDKNYTKDEIKQLRDDFFSQLKVPGIYEVGGLGACTLISKTALKKQISFSEISNLSFWGEDRHFCVRATTLGLKLYVDTVYPAYHIYREEYLSGVEDFKKNGFDPYNFNYNPINKNKNKQRFKKIISKFKIDKKELKKKYHTFKYLKFLKKRIVKENNDITLSMIVKNEENRYLKECLTHAKKYINNFVIIDDASTDNTVKLCKEILSDKNLKIVVNEKSMFSNEIKLRKKQWKETIATNPSWIMFLDADEVFEDKIIKDVEYLLKDKSVDAYCFRLYDIWKEGYYRDDEYWKAHHIYRPFLIRYQPKFKYKFINQKQHCGRMPKNVLILKHINSNIRLKHYGWLNDEDKKNKYLRYKELDKGFKIGNKAQYESIMDKNPNLIKFEESDEN